MTDTNLVGVPICGDKIHDTELKLCYVIMTLRNVIRA